MQNSGTTELRSCGATEVQVSPYRPYLECYTFVEFPTRQLTNMLAGYPRQPRPVSGRTSRREDINLDAQDLDATKTTPQDNLKDTLRIINLRYIKDTSTLWGRQRAAAAARAGSRSIDRSKFKHMGGQYFPIYS